MTATFKTPHFRTQWNVDTAACLMPRVNVADSDTELSVYVFLPGVTKEDVTVNVSDERVLTIKGEKKRGEQPEGLKFQRKERRFGAFKRQFYLPKHVSSENIGATFENGVLTVTLQKTQPKTTTVEIK